MFYRATSVILLLTTMMTQAAWAQRELPKFIYNKAPKTELPSWVTMRAAGVKRAVVQQPMGSNYTIYRFPAKDTLAVQEIWSNNQLKDKFIYRWEGKDSCIFRYNESLELVYWARFSLVDSGRFETHCYLVPKEGRSMEHTWFVAKDAKKRKYREERIKRDQSGSIMEHYLHLYQADGESPLLQIDSSRNTPTGQMQCNIYFSFHPGSYNFACKDCKAWNNKGKQVLWRKDQVPLFPKEYPVPLTGFQMEFTRDKTADDDVLYEGTSNIPEKLPPGYLNAWALDEKGTWAMTDSFVTVMDKGLPQRTLWYDCKQKRMLKAEYRYFYDAAGKRLAIRDIKASRWIWVHLKNPQGGEFMVTLPNGERLHLEILPQQLGKRIITRQYDGSLRYSIETRLKEIRELRELDTFFSGIALEELLIGETMHYNDGSIDSLVSWNYAGYRKDLITRRIVAQEYNQWKMKMEVLQGPSALPLPGKSTSGQGTAFRSDTTISFWIADPVNPGLWILSREERSYRTGDAGSLWNNVYNNMREVKTYTATGEPLLMQRFKADSTGHYQLIQESKSLFKAFGNQERCIQETITEPLSGAGNSMLPYYRYTASYATGGELRSEELFHWKTGSPQDTLNWGQHLIHIQEAGDSVVYTETLIRRYKAQRPVQSRYSWVAQYDAQKRLISMYELGSLSELRWEWDSVFPTLPSACFRKGENGTENLQWKLSYER